MRNTLIAACISLLCAIPFSVQATENFTSCIDPEIEITFEKKDKPTLHPKLKPVCACESSYSGKPSGTPRQYDPDGTVRKGRMNANDIGMCQVNRRYHISKAKALGYDIYTREGNIRYANHLYERKGLSPWKWSKPCWDQAVE